MRIANFANATIDYCHKLNSVYEKFDEDGYMMTVNFIMALNCGQRKQLIKLHGEQTKLLNELKDEIRGEDEESTQKKQLSKSYQIRNHITDNLKEKIEHLICSFDKNAKRIFMYDPEDITISKIVNCLFGIVYKNGVIVCFANLEHGYKTDQVPFKKLLKETMPKFEDEHLWVTAEKILNDKVTVNNEFKNTINNWEIAVLVEAYNRFTTAQTGKSFIDSDFDKNTIEKRVLNHGNQDKYQDCIRRKHNYLSIRYVDTLNDGSSREVVVPLSINQIRGLLLEVTGNTPPLAA